MAGGSTIKTSLSLLALTPLPATGGGKDPVFPNAAPNPLALDKLALEGPVVGIPGIEMVIPLEVLSRPPMTAFNAASIPTSRSS